jgi:hypothetical protein
MPEQQYAVRDRINSLAGTGIEQGFRDRQSDPSGNLSPTEQAGTTASRPKVLPAAPNMPNLLSTTPNINGLATLPNPPLPVPSPPPQNNLRSRLNSIAGFLPNARTPMFLPKNTVQTMQYNELPEREEARLGLTIDEPESPQRRTALEDVERRPSQVDLLRQYKEQMGQLQDPYAVAKDELAKRGTGAKILDAVLGGLSGLGQGGLLGAIGGGIGGYKGVPREQAIMDRVNKQNTLKRQGIMDRYGIDKAILDQTNTEEDDYQKRRDLAYKQDKEYNDQEQLRVQNERQAKLDELKAQADADKAAVDRRQLSVNEYNARRQMLEFKLQRLKELYPGQILKEGDSDLGVEAGFRVPDRPSDRPGIAYTPRPDAQGNIYQYDPKNPDSAPKIINTGQTPNNAQQEKDWERQAETEAIESMNKDFPGSRMRNPDIRPEDWAQIEQIQRDNPNVWGAIIQKTLGYSPKDLYRGVDPKEFTLRKNKAYDRLKNQGKAAPASTAPTVKAGRSYTSTDIQKYQENRSNPKYRQAFINKFGVDPETLVGK